MTTVAVPVLKRPDDLGMGEAFTRDGFLEREVRAIVARLGVQTVIETGTWRGYTARRFSEFVPHVHTIEVDQWLHVRAADTLCDRPGVHQYHGDSAEILPTLMPPLSWPALFYLDAHWQDRWPLFDEIDAIAAQEKPCAIVIHDVKVPGKDFGFDSYGGRALTFELVKPNLDRLAFPWRHYFNTETEGHRRGALFVVPE